MQKTDNNWTEIMSLIKQTSLSLWTALQSVKHITITFYDRAQPTDVQLWFEHEFTRKLVDSETKRQVIQDAFREVVGWNVKVYCGICVGVQLAYNN
jgi:hypothetical protein